MAEKPQSEKPVQKTGSATGAESPTTARPLDFDDEPQESAPAAHESGTAQPGTKPTVSFQDEETPPPKPPRPMSPQAQAEATLVEAFPGIDGKVIRAVLLASGGQVEPAFNALLSMSDPDFRDEAPPPQPPRKTQPRTQLQSDEMYARQLAAHYQSSNYDGYGSQHKGDPPLRSPRGQSGLKPNELQDKDYSFFDDDLPVIRENMRKGFLETQAKVNKWITDFKKRIDGDDDDDDDDDELNARSANASQRQTSYSQPAYGARRSTEAVRRSSDRERYDPDPRALGDDFTTLELRDDEALPPRHQNRPPADLDLSKPTPRAPQTGPVDEIDALYHRPGSTNRQPDVTSAAKTKKWQPLTAVAPNPEADDGDPFSLGDSDDEQHDSKTKDLKAEDTERLKKAAAEAAKRNTGSKTGELQPAQQSESTGTKDQEAENLLAGKT